jgi:hypothetical protein
MIEVWLVAFVAIVAVAGWLVAEFRGRVASRVGFGLIAMIMILLCTAAQANLRVRLANDAARLDLWQTRLALRSGHVAEVEAALDSFSRASKLDERRKRDELYDELKRIANSPPLNESGRSEPAVTPGSK